MSVFAGYAHYYDLLYRDKDYVAETRYVGELLECYAPRARRLLELGCGTGAYSECLARAGYSVDGLDLSPDMVEQATIRTASLPEELRARLRFVSGDAREAELGRSYEAVVALFHVLSYQQGNADVLAFLRAASRHLEAGGVAIFDFWYGPAVLAERPSVRVKRCGDEEVSLTRIAEPVMRTGKNLVEVNYELLVTDQNDHPTVRLTEQHVMRYFFLPELELFLEATGLTLVAALRWLTWEEPDEHGWSGCVVARK